MENEKRSNSYRRHESLNSSRCFLALFDRLSEASTGSNPCSFISDSPHKPKYVCSTSNKVMVLLALFHRALIYVTNKILQHT